MSPAIEDIEAKNTGRGRKWSRQSDLGFLRRSRTGGSGDRPGVCAYALRLPLVMLAAALGAAPDGLQHGLLHDVLVHVLRHVLSTHGLEAEGVGAGRGGLEDAEPQLVEGLEHGDEQPRAALVGEDVDEEPAVPAY